MTAIQIATGAGRRLSAYDGGYSCPASTQDDDDNFINTLATAGFTSKFYADDAGEARIAFIAGGEGWAS